MFRDHAKSIITGITDCLASELMLSQFTDRRIEFAAVITFCLSPGINPIYQISVMVSTAAMAARAPTNHNGKNRTNLSQNTPIISIGAEQIRGGRIDSHR
jgi:hypothetical protein